MVREVPITFHVAAGAFLGPAARRPRTTQAPWPSVVVVAGAGAARLGSRGGALGTGRGRLLAYVGGDDYLMVSARAQPAEQELLFAR